MEIADDGAHQGFQSLRTRRAWYFIAVLLLIGMLSNADRVALVALVVPVQNDLGLSNSQMGLLLGPAFVVSYVIASLPMGYFADRVNRRNILIGGVLLWNMSTFASSFARSFEMLLFLRSGVGVGEACFIPCAYSMIADYFSPDKRGRAISLVAAGSGLGSGLSLYISGMLLAGSGTSLIAFLGDLERWRLILATFGALGLIPILLLLFIDEPRRHRAPAAPASDLGSRDAPDPFFREHWRELALIIAPYVLSGFIIAAMVSWLPATLSREQVLSLADSAKINGVMMFVVMPVSAVIGGFLADKFVKAYADGRFRLAAMLVPLYFPACLLILCAPSQPFRLAGMALFYFAAGVISTSVFAAVQEIVPNPLRGRMLALYQLLANLLGASLGTMSVALVSDYVLGDQNKLGASLMITVIPCAVVASLLCIFGLRPYRKLLALAGQDGRLGPA